MKSHPGVPLRSLSRAQQEAGLEMMAGGAALRAPPPAWKRRLEFASTRFTVKGSVTLTLF